MYKLTLTFAEREALDWVGHRDWNGEPLRKLLWNECESIVNIPQNSPEMSEEELERLDIQYDIPEHVAWEIMAEYIEAGETIPHFVPELKAKIQTLLDSIV